MLKSSIICCSPLYKELKRNKLDFMVYYIRYPYDKVKDCRGLPCAVVVTTMDENKKFSRGISVCSTNEKNFNALQGFEIAAARVLKANKLHSGLEFVFNGQEIDFSLETVKGYADKIKMPLMIYQYDVLLTKKELNHERNPGWISLIV